MVGWILKKVLGSKNQRELKRMMPTVRRINELDEQFKSLSDEELRAKSAQWREELARHHRHRRAVEKARRFCRKHSRW
jgi:preprotein translocase subunit SecA